jgi:lipopolysaccharide/colanic/teichoic acid biosynthesis glycosyltransferase
MTKRAFDIFFSLIGIILLSPLLLAIAVLIRLDSQGPVFFRQVRIGRYGVPFRIRKFRTMRWNPDDFGPQITVGADSRITDVGRTLRRFKLDELPQLIDVLAGKMSLVGPRPEVPEYVTYYTTLEREIIFNIRPGITDNSSIIFRNESNILSKKSNPSEYYISDILPMKINHHLHYASNHGIFIDITIIIKTILIITHNK